MEREKVKNLIFGLYKLSDEFINVEDFEQYKKEVNDFVSSFGFDLDEIYNGKHNDPEWDPDWNISD